MKKRCTNSACRKVFTAESVCPYCGKEYLRVQDPHSYGVYLRSFGNRIKVIMLIGKRMGMYLSEAMRVVEGAPSVCCKGVTRQEADAMCSALRKAGASAKVIYLCERCRVKG